MYGQSGYGPSIRAPAMDYSPGFRPYSTTPTITYAPSSSGLESTVTSYSLSATEDTTQSVSYQPISNSTYSPHQESHKDNKYSNQYKVQPTTQYVFAPESFLKPDRPKTKFIGSAQDVRSYIEQAFMATMGKPLPNDIVIHVCPVEELKKTHTKMSGKWSDGIQGFALNRSPFVSDIFIKENNLDQLMLTIGHEIGHVLSTPLPDQRDEEAKAFAFSRAWMETIKRDNIANLADSIVLDNPAKNGLHDVAFGFLQGLLKKGISAMSVFRGLMEGKFSITNTLDEIVT